MPPSAAIVWEMGPPDKDGWDDREIVAAAEAIRQRLGISKSELGRRLGSGYQLFQSWVSGRRVPEAASVRMLAMALGVSADELLGLVSPGREVRIQSEEAARALEGFLAGPIGPLVTVEEREYLSTLDFSGAGLPNDVDLFERAWKRRRAEASGKRVERVVDVTPQLPAGKAPLKRKR